MNDAGYARAPTRSRREPRGSHSSTIRLSRRRVTKYPGLRARPLGESGDTEDNRPPSEAKVPRSDAGTDRGQRRSRQAASWKRCNTSSKPITMAKSIRLARNAMLVESVND
jgi:hypothetical protein